MFISDELGTLPNSNKLIGDEIKIKQRGEIQSDVGRHKGLARFHSNISMLFFAQSTFDTNGLALNKRVEMECIGAFRSQ